MVPRPPLYHLSSEWAAGQVLLQTICDTFARPEARSEWQPADGLLDLDGHATTGEPAGHTSGSGAAAHAESRRRVIHQRDRYDGPAHARLSPRQARRTSGQTVDDMPHQFDRRRYDIRSYREAEALDGIPLVPEPAHHVARRSGVDRLVAASAPPPALDNNTEGGTVMHYLFRGTVLIGLTIGVLLLATGCRDRAPDQAPVSNVATPPTQQPIPSYATAPPAAASSVPPFTIGHPLDISEVSETPCSTVPHDVLAPLSPGAGRLVSSGGVATCWWQSTTDKNRRMSLTFKPAAVKMQYDYAAAQPPGSPVTAVQIGGYPAVTALDRPGGRYSCNVSVAVADGIVQTGFLLNVLSPIEDACSRAGEVAAAIIAGLSAPH
ncbi:MAG TPA: DUF3558 family protein [Pseudonocardiaceae bacterium]|jgi:hypothetical protein